jgi:IclR family transcriptional regulator, acetate operon repressor
MSRVQQDLPGKRAPRGTGPSRDPIAKTIRLLAWMVDRGAQTSGVREIAQAFGMPPSTVHRLLSALEHEGLMQRLPSGRYQLGLEFFRLAWRSTSHFPIRDVAVPRLEKLAAASEETALLGLYDPARRQMLFAASAESVHSLRYVVELNKWLPVHSGASGLAILAFLPDDEISSVLGETALTPLTDATITEPDELRRALARTRERGYAFTRGQRIAGAVGIAAPIWDPNGRVIGDVMVTMPEHRFAPASERQLATLVMDAAAQITDLIGGKGTGSPAE